MNPPETSWKGVLSHDLEPNRTYAEVSRIAVPYPYASGLDLLTNAPMHQGRALMLKPWDLAIIAEQ